MERNFIVSFCKFNVRRKMLDVGPCKDLKSIPSSHVFWVGQKEGGREDLLQAQVRSLVWCNYCTQLFSAVITPGLQGREGGIFRQHLATETDIRIYRYSKHPS